MAVSTNLCQIAQNIAENLICDDVLGGYEEALKIFLATFQEGLETALQSIAPYFDAQSCSHFL